MCFAKLVKKIPQLPPLSSYSLEVSASLSGPSRGQRSPDLGFLPVLLVLTPWQHGNLVPSGDTPTKHAEAV